MEGRPRFDQEQPAEDDNDDSKESSKKKRTKARSFSLSGFVERSRVGESEETDRPEGRSILSRYERIRNRKDARPLIAEVQPIEVQAESKIDIAPSDEVENHDLLSEEELEAIVIDHNPDTELETAAHELSAEDPLDSQLPVVIESAEEERPVWPPVPAIETVEIVPELSEAQDTGDAETSYEQSTETLLVRPEASKEERATGLPDTVPVSAEPESIEAILNRRLVERDDTTEIEIETVEAELGTVGENVVINNNNFTRNETNIYNENRNTGLHLLNYALARRRDARDRSSANKQFKKVDTRIEELAKRQKEMEYEKSLLEKQQERTKSLPEVMTVFDRNKVIEKNIVDQKTTRKHEKDSNVSVKILETKNILSPTPDSESSPQRVVERVHTSPEVRGIVSERVYEQRHEIKDQGQAPAVSAVPFTNQQAQYSDPAASQPVQQSYTSSGHPVQRPLSSQKSEGKTVDYKEAAVTGAWGAIVGTVVFILLYILTR